MKERNSNIELLRLCSMMMIMVLHFLGHSRYIGGNIFSADVLIWNLMESLCISSTAIFVLISGYFGINFKIKGILKLYLSCAAWGIVGYVIYCSCANTPPRGSNEIIRSSNAIYARKMVVHHNLFGVVFPVSNTQCSNRAV